jgi:hypothetical protein
MAELNYDCYAYFCINHAKNTYPIKEAERHLGIIYSLQKGDVLHIKGEGHLQVVSLNVDDYDWKVDGEDYMYQEIAIACEKVEY